MSSNSKGPNATSVTHFDLGTVYRELSEDLNSNRAHNISITMLGTRSFQEQNES